MAHRDSQGAPLAVDWSAYGQQYQQLMAQIPAQFARHALRHLLDTEGSRPMVISDQAQGPQGPQSEEPLFRRPVRMVDIAAGPAVFTHELFQHMHAAGQRFAPESQFVVTDASESMLTAARATLQRLVAAEDAAFFSSLGLVCDDDSDASAVRFETVDAREAAATLLGRWPAGFTHATCLFGVMFVGAAQVASVLRQLHALVAPQRGVAVLSTWQSVTTAAICDAFGRFVDADAPATRPEPSASPLAIGRDPAALRQQLLDAGFARVTVHEPELTLHVRPLEDEAFYRSLVENPAVLAAHPELSPLRVAPEALRAHWVAFFAPGAPGHAQFVTEPAATVAVTFRANVAVAEV
eukprot:gene12237-8758_t